MTRHDDNPHTPLWRLFLLTVVLFAVLPAMSQNNPYKINDQLYAVYQKANKLRYKKEGLAVAAEMYRRAEAIGDRKAQCIALTMPVQYYYQTRSADGAEFERAVKQLQDCARKYGYMQYFYYAVSSRVLYLIAKKGQPVEALVYMEEMAEYARRNKHVYGIFSGLKDMAQFHRIHSENILAIDCYRQAIDLGSEYLPDQDMAPLYRKIAECCENIYDYNGMYDWARRGLAFCKTAASRKSLIAKMCVAAFFKGDSVMFRRHFAEYGEIDRRTTDLVEKELLAVKAVCDGDEGLAYEIVESIPDGVANRMKAQLWMEVARMMGQYDVMANNQRVFYRTRINNNDSVYSGGFGMIDSRFMNMRLTFENQQLESEHQRLENERQLADINNANLELANTRLLLRNSSLELARTKSQADIMRLSYSRKRLEAARLRSEIATAHARQAVGDTLFTACTAFGLLFLAAVGLYMRSRNKLMARLQATNRQLEMQHSQLAEALDRAQAADRAKSGFISNMGQDIRRPLDATVRSARMIAASRHTNDRPRVAELNRQLQHDTQAMLDIVAGVLEKANKL